MKYEKPDVEVIEIDSSEFMLCSGNGKPQDTCPSDAGHGHSCGTYVKGESCSSWTSTSWNASCGNFNGKKCYGYSDSSHSYCTEYGFNCKNF